MEPRIRVEEPVHRICSWCEKTISGGEGAALVSHGICRECRADLEAELWPVACGGEVTHGE